MIFVVTEYWPYLLVALLAGVAVGWWGQALAAHRRRLSRSWEDGP